MLITNFASGELSPNLNGRVDIRQYYQGASRIENFEIVPTGGIKRRPGTKRIASLSGESRIIPFIVDKNSVFVLQLTASEINIWQKGVTGEYSVFGTLSKSYGSLAVVKEIQYAQNYNTLILTHKSFTPYQIVFNGSTFEGANMTFDLQPFVELDDDYDFIMLVADGQSEPSATTLADGRIQFTYYMKSGSSIVQTTKTFEAGTSDFYYIREGKIYKKHNSGSWQPFGTDAAPDEGLFTTTTKYPSCAAFFNNRLFFASTAAKPQAVYGSAAPDNSGTRYNCFGTYKKYVTVNKVAKDADLHLFTCNIRKGDIDIVDHMTTLTSVSQNFTANVLKNPATDYYVTSDVIPIGTKVLSITQTTITINTDNIDIQWGDGETERDNLVMSIQLWRNADSISAEDYEHAVVSRNITTADCGMFFELASDQNDAIKFLSSNRFLAVGTESSIWSIDAGISALSINAVMQGRYGSDSIQGQAVETATVYFAQGKKGIREFYYDGQNSAFQTNNIALLADHILRESAIIDFDYMTNPFSRLILTRTDGTIAEMLYDKTNGIMAWSRIIHGKGTIKSCAVTRGEDENDYVFFVVKDGDDYFLELLDLSCQVFLDSWQLYEEPEENESDIADDYSDGAVLLNVTQNKQCPIDNIPTGFIAQGDTVYIGYKFRSYIKSMPVVGNDVTKKQRISALSVRFLESYRPVLKVAGLPDEKFTSIKDVPYSGIAKVTYPGQTDHDVCFELEAEEPEPVTILSIDAQTA